MIFDLFGNYDLAGRFGVSLGIVAGVVQIVFDGLSGTRAWVAQREETLNGPTATSSHSNPPARSQLPSARFIASCSAATCLANPMRPFFPIASARQSASGR